MVLPSVGKLNMINIRKCCIDPLYTVYHGLVTHRWSKHIRRYLAQNCLLSGGKCVHARDRIQGRGVVTCHNCVDNKKKKYDLGLEISFKNSVYSTQI